MLQVLDAAALRQWCALGLEALNAARVEIDDLNVYPVPDGDTGTNLALTMASVQEAVSAAPADLAATVKALVLGSLMGARGNSGVILSQLLRGLGDVIGPLSEIGPLDLKTALVSSAKSAYGAVAVPVEGTVLTVAREAAEAAEALGEGCDLASVVRTAREAAAAALARTPDLLPQLKAAGVVDAGGRGWCVLLEALEQVVTGTATAATPALLVARDRSGLAAARESGSEEFGYEVQFLLRDTTEQAVATLKQQLAPLGDSLVVVGGDGLYNVHVHVNDVGAAVEAGVDAGRPFRITVTRFEDQMAHAAADVSAGQAVATGRAIVAVAPGDGLARIFREAGAAVVDGGPTANPSTAELLGAIRRSRAREVVLLPNDGNVRAVAAAAAEQARQDGVSVVVIATRSVIQGLAAVSVANAQASFEDDVASMTAAATATRWAEVTTAVRASGTAAGACRPGDVLGLLEGSVMLVGSDVETVARDLLLQLLTEGGELATIVVGEQAAPGAGDRLSSYLQESHPSVQVQVLDGGQPHYPFLLGVE